MIIFTWYPDAEVAFDECDVSDLGDSAKPILEDLVNHRQEAVVIPIFGNTKTWSIFKLVESAVTKADIKNELKLLNAQFHR